MAIFLYIVGSLSIIGGILLYFSDPIFHTLSIESSIQGVIILAIAKILETVLENSKELKALKRQVSSGFYRGSTTNNASSRPPLSRTIQTRDNKKICKKCGQKNSETSMYCTGCGAYL